MTAARASFWNWTQPRPLLLESIDMRLQIYSHEVIQCTLQHLEGMMCAPGWQPGAKHRPLRPFRVLCLWFQLTAITLIVPVIVPPSAPLRP